MNIDTNRRSLRVLKIWLNLCNTSCLVYSVSTNSTLCFVMRLSCANFRILSSQKWFVYQEKTRKYVTSGYLCKALSIFVCKFSVFWFVFKKIRFQRNRNYGIALPILRTI